MQFGGQGGGRLGRGVPLRPRGRDPQYPGRPVGLEVHPGHQPVAEQERQHVIPVHPLLRRRVDLDPVAEVEQPLGPVPAPHQRVERTDQRGGPDPPGQPGRMVQVCRLAPAGHLDREQLAGVHQIADGGPRPGDREPEVVAQVRLGGHAERAGRDPDQLPERLRRLRRRGVEDLRRQDPLRCVVDPGEPAVAIGHQHLAVPEQPFQGDLRGRPVPPPVAATARSLDLQLGRGQRSLLPHGFPHLLDQPRHLAGQPLHTAPGVPVRHPPAQIGIQPHGQQRRLVSPVFEQLAGPPVGDRVQQRRRIGPEPAVERQVVGALQDVDRVDLQQPGPAKHPAQVPAVGRAAGPRVGEALGGQRDPACLGRRQRVHRPRMYRRPPTVTLAAC